MKEPKNKGSQVFADTAFAEEIGALNGRRLFTLADPDASCPWTDGERYGWFYWTDLINPRKAVSAKGGQGDE